MRFQRQGSYQKRGTRTIRQAWVPAFVLCLTAACGAFDSLLEVEAPSRVDAAILDDPANASLLVDGAISDFECALANHILAGGLMGNELIDGGLIGAMWHYDRRTTPTNSGLYLAPCLIAGSLFSAAQVGIYVPLSTARFQADNSLTRLEAWTDAQVTGRNALIATAAAFAGYGYVLMGEIMCTSAVDGGPELSPAQLFALAETRFTRAMTAAQAAGSADLQNFARVGRARARLGQGKKADALADAEVVPDGYVKSATYSRTALRRENRVFAFINRNGSAAIDQPFRDLNFQGVPDGRVSVTAAGRLAADNVTPLWIQAKYGSEAASIPIARWAEARLIVAEAQGGQAAVGIINVLHTRAGLPAFNSTDPAAIQAQIVEERRRELFLESHHIGDLRRYNLPLFPAPGTPYPPKAGGTYGEQRCLPLPDVERLNNPSLGG